MTTSGPICLAIGVSPACHPGLAATALIVFALEPLGKKPASISISRVSWSGILIASPVPFLPAVPREGT